MKKVVITGATGAIGRSLINVCIEAGYDVLAVVHRSSQRAGELSSMAHCEVLKLDLDEYDNAIEEMQKQKLDTENFELFFHLAWMAPFGKDRDNLNLQIKNISDALAAVRFAKALGCTTFLGTGSQAEYGRVEGMLSEDTPVHPETGYGITKLCAGQLTRLNCNQLGLKHIWCRILSVYGPYDRDQTLISTAVIKMMANEETEFTPCDQMWDYIYSDDAAKAILLMAQNGSHEKTYVLGCGEVHPLRKYIEQIAAITNYTQEIGFGKKTYNDNQVMYLQADIGELSKLGFVPQISFSEGIRRTIEWRKGN